MCFIYTYKYIITSKCYIIIIKVFLTQSQEDLDML